MSPARLLAALAAALALAAAPPTRACTTFALAAEDARVVGKSYDWPLGHGVVALNRRGLAKQAIALDPRDAPARWVSRYASLTFDQYGLELPNGGLNEAGLVIEVMWLAESEPEPRDARPVVNELQWIQLQLDTRATTAEVLAHLGEVRVARAYGRVHYLVCDRGGACAAIEWIGGRPVVSTGARALTNDSFARSAAYLDALGARAPDGQGSLPRFARAARAARRPADGPLEAAAFRTLDAVRTPQSQWQIVYDPGRLRVSFRTRRDRAVRWVDLGRLDGACGPALGLDLDAGGRGDVTARLRPLTAADQGGLVRRSLAGVPGLPPGTVERVARYPLTVTCAAP